VEPAEGDSDRTGADGRFAIEGLPAGEYRLKLQRRMFSNEAGGTDESEAGTIQVREGETTEVRIERPPGVRLHGVARRGGRPIGRGDLEATRPEAGWSSCTEVRPTGGYDLDLPGAGTYRLRFKVFSESLGLLDAAVEVEVPISAGRLRRDIELPEWRPAKE
jgi:hypothetical protein